MSEVKKNIPVNKYSIYDLKTAVDTRIVEVNLFSKLFFEIVFRE
jgi:hypothetical protein